MMMTTVVMGWPMVGEDVVVSGHREALLLSLSLSLQRFISQRFRIVADVDDLWQTDDNDGDGGNDAYDDDDDD